MSIPAFLIKTYEMVDDPSCNDLISWSLDGTSFHVYDPVRFAKTLLPRKFKHDKFSSFIRQLNYYGFLKIGDPNTWEFQHDGFQRARPDLLRTIRRKTADASKRVPERKIEFKPRNEAEDMRKEIEVLKSQNANLWRELQQSRQQCDKLQETVQSLKRRDTELTEELTTLRTELSQTQTEEIVEPSHKRRKIKQEDVVDYPYKISFTPYGSVSDNMNLTADDQIDISEWLAGDIEQPSLLFNADLQAPSVPDEQEERHQPALLFAFNDKTGDSYMPAVSPRNLSDNNALASFMGDCSIHNLAFPTPQTA